jgi:hypothetical protein
MTRHLFFAIALIGSGVLLVSPAAATTAAQCEEQGLNCEGGCPDITGGAGAFRGRQNMCIEHCVRRVNACLVNAHLHRVPVTRPNPSIWPPMR